MSAPGKPTDCAACNAQRDSGMSQKKSTGPAKAFGSPLAGEHTREAASFEGIWIPIPIFCSGAETSVHSCDPGKCVPDSRIDYAF